MAVSLNLPSNIDVKTVGWKKISGWQAPTETVHSIAGTELDVTKSHINVAHSSSGIYAVFTTVSFRGIESGETRIAIILNDEKDNLHPGLTSSVSGGPLGPNTLTVQGTLLLQAGDYVSVSVYSESDFEWTISGQSMTTFSMQFVGHIGSVPGFSAVLSKSIQHTSSGWKTIRRWKVEGTPGIFTSMTGFSRQVGEFVPICEGIYFISANVRIATNDTKYFQLAIAINGNSAGNIVKQLSTKLFTLSISSSLHLKKGDIISLQLSGETGPYEISTDSGFFAVFLSEKSSGISGM